MIRKIYIILICAVISFSAYAQDSITIANNKKPVRDPWSCNLVIDNQTTYAPAKGSLELMIHHRFSGFGNGSKDLYGFYGASNIRLGLNYGLTKKIMIGFGTEKDKKYQEFLIKYALLEQNRGGSIPVSISLYGNTCINERDKSYWGSDYKFIDRLSYFAQIIISRKLTDALSLEVAGSWSHINKVESIKLSTEDENNITKFYKSLYKNDALGISAAGRYKLMKDYAIIAEYDQGIYTGLIGYQQLMPQPNIAFGFEKATSTAFFPAFCFFLSCNYSSTKLY